MPIYEYQCQSCGKLIEVIQKFSDDPLTNCDSCGKPDLKKKVSAPAFRLSGSGWYETDFKSGNKKNLSSSDNKSTETKKTKTKTDTASTTKKPSKKST